MGFFKTFTNRYKANLAHIRNKDRKLFDIVTTLALTLPEITRIRKITEKGGEIHGWQTWEVGRWHDDENGPLEVNGRRGYYTYEIIEKSKPNLLTNAGRDFIHNQAYTNTSAGTRGSGYVAVTTDAGAPDAADTTLASEITTGGLGRADADTKTHTTGTNVTTIEHTYTASATHTAVVKSGLFNAASSGIMTHENTFTTVTLQSNDTLRVTWTLTLG